MSALPPTPRPDGRLLQRPWGDNFHFGYWDGPDDTRSVAEATDRGVAPGVRRSRGSSDGCRRARLWRFGGFSSSWWGPCSSWTGAPGHPDRDGLGGAIDVGALVSHSKVWGS
jgi:hypothetical protein